MAGKQIKQIKVTRNEDGTISLFDGLILDPVDEIKREALGVKKVVTKEVENWIKKYAVVLLPSEAAQILNVSDKYYRTLRESLCGKIDYGRQKERKSDFMSYIQQTRHGVEVRAVKSATIKRRKNKRNMNKVVRTLEEKMNSTHFKEDEINAKGSSIKQLSKASGTVEAKCIENCWCRSRKFCNVKAGTKCRFDLSEWRVNAIGRRN